MYFNLGTKKEKNKQYLKGRCLSSSSMVSKAPPAGSTLTLVFM